MSAMQGLFLLLFCAGATAGAHSGDAVPHLQQRQQQRQSPSSSRRQLHAAVAAAVPAAAAQPAGLGDALHGLTSLINGIEATLPSLDLLSIPSLPELKLTKAAALDPKKQKLHLLLSAASNAGSSSDAASLPPGTPSFASSVGFAFNGGIASAKSTSHAGKAGSAGPSAAESDATAVADRASLSLAVSKSDAANLVPAAGLGTAKASAMSVADHSSISVSDAASLTVGLGGRSSSSETTSNSAASGGGAAYVGGTAVSSAGPGSSSLTVSTGSGAAQHKGTALTRADSIALGALGDATGSATADSRATQLGAASSTSLMESFAFGGGSRSDAASTAKASALQAGLSRVQDKAVAIGLDGATSATNTGSQGTGQKLGLSVIDSVVRTILAGREQKSCAEAVNQAYSDSGTGPAVSLDTFILHLAQRADHQCVTSFKALLGKQQAAAGNALGVRDSAGAISSGGNLASALPAPGVAADAAAALPSVEGVKGSVLARTAPSLLRAAAVMDGLLQQLVSQAKQN